MTFYGEGEDEDERFRIWLANFGIKFNREDALLLKDYDLKESLPDWQQINTARKQLLVTIDQVYPYVGTYKGLLNLINVLGYRDVLRVKEYWRDSDPSSLYYQKFAMVDVTDLMQVGELSEINLVDENGQMKKGGKFKKTELLALTYAFTKAGDTYDDDGLPEVVETTDFTVDEIFFKLNGVSRKLKEEILPINVLIKDVIGEFIYFSKFNLRNWPDTTFIESTDLSDAYSILITMPNVISTDLKIRDLKPLYPKLNGTSAFPDITFNLGEVEPYQDGQQYPADQIDYLINAITDYYSSVTHHDFYHIGETDALDNGDDTVNKIGCPIILEAYITDLMLKDLDGITFGDFILSEATTSSTMNSIGLGTKYFACATTQSFRVGSKVKMTVSIDQSSYMEGIIEEIGPTGFPANTIKVAVDSIGGNSTSTGWVINLIDTHFTIGSLRYKNGYEIEWIIDGPQNYHFEWRDSVANVAKIPHILPHTGEYTILVKVHDMQGGTSIDYRKLTVQEESPILQAFVKIQDKTRYDLKTLSNVTISDLGDSPLYRPYATIINLNGENAPLSSVYSHYLDWYTYSHNYGVGDPQEEAQIFDSILGFQPHSVSVNPTKNRWGTGSANGQPTISDYQTAALRDLRFITFGELGYVGDTIDGFYIDLLNLNPLSPASYLTSMQFGGFTEVDFFTLTQTPTDLLTYLQSADLPGWKEYSYQLFGDRIKATAKFQDKKNHSILKFISSLAGIFNATDYLPSSLDLDISSDVIKLGECTLFQTQMIGPSGPFWLGPSGPFWYGPSGPLWENPSNWYNVGPSGVTPFGPSGLEWNDSVNLLWPDPIDPLWPNPSSWSFPTIYSNTALKLGDRLRIRNAGGGYAEGFVIRISDYDVVIDVDLINEIGDFTAFDLAIVNSVYTFNRPVSVFNYATIANVQAALANVDLALDDDLLFLTCPFVDQLISARSHRSANASDIRYWIDAGFVSYDNTTETQTGYLPSDFDQNSLNMTSVRATYNTMIVPLFHPIFIIISNLTSNVETEWTLTLGETTVARIKTTSYFIWRFDVAGDYSLSVQSTDTRGNVSVLNTQIKAITSLNVDEYQNFVENQLNDRKYQMTH
jgi:hypothetical protein